ncbi:hypothetical protein HanXRQr2_Chr14g0621311 [Helianthus annuus]|uniref:Uncharacterized protein n=1 Tax=Helianthus annuus TaxID=4232 RepID=A0A9K3E526_HELAN|nr:hypothetical protein HanXRQr2_Chr14g0621311 [Helianthus annuus]KAJ0838571.1 hypothetical protein HanPSC8_Chr14g0596451 [Helianthus annuus]
MVRTTERKNMDDFSKQSSKTPWTNEIRRHDGKDGLKHSKNKKDDSSK